ncbi:MAG: dihydrolipoamide acetyltransferase family protein [Kribbellaceae bacterium]
MAEFRMPSLGADMDEGTVVEWLVKPGDHVNKGDIVAVVDTAKAAVEVETFVGGTVDDLLVPVGEWVEVGTPLAAITADTDLAAPAAVARMPEPEPESAPKPEPKPKPKPEPEPEPKARRPGRPATSRKPVVATVAAPTGSADGLRPKASPYARKLARDLGVDLTTLTPPGHDRLITSEDVRTAAGSIPATPVPAAPATPERAREAAAPRSQQERQQAMRSAIAKLMTRSSREIPHYYLTTTVDLAKVTDWLRRRNLELAVSERLVPAALLLKATALAARQRPELNGFWIDDAFKAAPEVNLGIAVSLRGGGLVAPAIHGVTDLAVEELMSRLRDLVTRARAGRLRRTELTDATLTVTNLGEQGVESVHGVIYPPQVALVGIGRVIERPWAVDGLLGIRPCVTLTLAADHRATDGFTGSRFLDTIDQLLQKPEEL